MKQLLLAIIMVCMVAVVVAAAPTILYPNGGEMFTAGTVNVTWAGSGTLWNLDFTSNNGSTWNPLLINQTMPYTLAHSTSDNVDWVSGNLATPWAATKKNDTYFYLYGERPSSGDKGQIVLWDAASGTAVYSASHTNTCPGFVQSYNLEQFAGDIVYDGTDVFTVTGGRWAALGCVDYLNLSVRKYDENLTLQNEVYFNDTTTYGANYVGITVLDSKLYVFWSPDGADELWGFILNSTDLSIIQTYTNLSTTGYVSDVQTDGSNIFLVYGLNDQSAFYITKLDSSLSVVSTSADIDTGSIGLKGDLIGTSDCELYNKSDFSYITRADADCMGCKEIAGGMIRKRNCFVAPTSSGWARFKTYLSGGVMYYLYTLFSDTGSSMVDSEFTETSSPPNAPRVGVATASDSYIVDLSTIYGDIEAHAISISPPDYSYLWDINAALNSALYLVRVNADGGSWDESDATFTICTPDWQCDLYGDCLINDTQLCIAATDNNTCGLTYTGNYSEFPPQACDFCLPTWSCSSSELACPPSKTKECLTVADFNGCYAQTNLSADQFNGTLSAYGVECGYNSTFASGDLPAITKDIGGETIFNILLNATFIVAILMAGIAVVAVNKAIGRLKK